MRRVTFFLALLMWLLTANPAWAHPLGSYTTNVHVGVVLSTSATEIQLVVDMAEIPAFRESREIIDTSLDGIVSDHEGASYAAQSCGDLRTDLGVTRNGGALEMTSTASTVSFPPGQGGLTTLRLECLISAGAMSVGDRITIVNQVYADRLGWSEITVKSEGVATATDLPSNSPSAVLTEYPSGPPLSLRSGEIVVGSESETVLVATGDGPIATLGENLSQSAGVAALAVALGLGVIHALAPGHGKTLMAAYLVGRQGAPRQAVILGLSVAAAHTAGVAILGVVTLVASESFQPDRVYPWLSAASAGIVTAIGVVMLIRAFAKRNHQHHEHDHHDHHDHPQPLGWRSLAALGLAGGMVPSASAVVLLLGGVSTGRPWFGLALVASFGVGMSVALVGAGLAALGLSRIGWNLLPSEHLRHRWQHLVPRLAGVAVTSIGLILVWSSAG